jgi:hypothetical protein
MPAIATETPSNVISASTLAGYRVRSGGDEDLGTIEEIMVEPESGRIAYAVLCLVRAPEFADKLFAVPWGLLRLNAAERTVVFEWDSSKLDSAPAFDQNDWPDFSDEDWVRAIREYYRNPYPTFSNSV